MHNNRVDEFAIYLFNNGKNFRAFDTLGSHRHEDGYSFAVWAPNAAAVSVVGDFNNWEQGKNKMLPVGKTGVWYTFVPSVRDGQYYKYAITTKGGKDILKIDPFAYRFELRPGTASQTWDIEGYKWSDKRFFNRREKMNPYSNPMNIYEMHLGSWRQHDDGTFYNYREMADAIAPYVSEMGYTHIEIMPVSEYPFDGSWGYQVSGYYAATSRYGTPQDLMYFVDKCHEYNISVIMDWVPAHFPRDAHALAFYDGAPTFEYADSRLGEHKEWGTLVFDYTKSEVISFLISNAVFWLEKYHIDGIRVDAVSSMLYRDYNRTEWLPNVNGGKENLEAVSFLQKLNSVVYEKFPYALMIAEESTAWPLVTKPVSVGGLGFGFKWNMGWMNDMLRYMSMDPLFRKGNHNLLTFSMMYAFSENYIMPLSHDEVVHGKCSLVEKMSGLYDQKFDSLRAFLGYMNAHPGKKLMFMGGENAQFIEWRFYEGLDWNILDTDKHRYFHEFVKENNKFYLAHKPFWEIEDSWDGFSWINASDAEKSIVVFVRKGRRRGDNIFVVSNFTPVRYPKYTIGMEKSGEYEIVFSTNEKRFGGSGEDTVQSVKTTKKESDGLPYRIYLDIPPMTTMYIRKKSKPKSQKGLVSK
ncbi:MAG: 1,4-alpha-glucan branching protein GlgB [Clostridia bacterium]|nr:1,4-alpha-glucan branching protein GlgB [Clostridia bacterium]